MAETPSLRRWSATVLSIAVLVAVAIIARVGPSLNAGVSTGSVVRRGGSLQPAQVVAHHALSKRHGIAMRSGGPLAAKESAHCATADEQRREPSRASVAAPDAAVGTSYDATAPPEMF